MCAIDESMQTLKIPPLVLETDMEQKLFEEGRLRAEARKEESRLC